MKVRNFMYDYIIHAIPLTLVVAAILIFSGIFTMPKYYVTIPALEGEDHFLNMREGTTMIVPSPSGKPYVVDLYYCATHAEIEAKAHPVGKWTFEQEIIVSWHEDIEKLKERTESLDTP